MRDLAGRAALITGGGSGIGRGTTLALAAAGTHVAVADIDGGRAAEVARESSEQGAACVGVNLDVNRPEDFDAARDTMLERFGRVDIVMNNVGLVAVGLPDQIPLAEWERIVSTNLLSVARSNATFLPLLLEQGSGHIVNTASTAGLYAYAYERLPYSATKAGVIALSEALALYVRPRGIGVTCLCPGPVRTNIAETFRSWGPPVRLHSPGKDLALLTPEVVGEQVVAAIRADQFLLLTHPELQETLIARARDPESWLAGQIANLGDEKLSAAAMQTFFVDVPDSDLIDLRDRLARTRWPNEATAAPWVQGPGLDYLQELVRYWQGNYDWRKAEARLNSYPQFVTHVDGQRIHFLHVPSPHPGALPLVLSHGWPGSVVEFLDVIEPLTNPPDAADAFSLVIPSLPGYGFSGPTTAPGWHPRRMAAAFGTIMARLNYQRYGVQGGDWGSLISCNMADLEPERVAGLHVNFLSVPPPRGENPVEHEPADRFASAGRGYQQIQSTKPQTIGYLLDDSPAGLAGWIVEKFREWSDCAGDPEQSFTRDQLLTNVMIYWLTRTATSSARLYWEMQQAGRTALPQAPVTVPTGVANFPGEIARCERSWAERRYHIVHWTYPEPAATLRPWRFPTFLFQTSVPFFAW